MSKHDKGIRDPKWAEIFGHTYEYKGKFYADKWDAPRSYNEVILEHLREMYSKEFFTNSVYSINPLLNRIPKTEKPNEET